LKINHSCSVFTDLTTTSLHCTQADWGRTLLNRTTPAMAADALAIFSELLAKVGSGEHTSKGPEPARPVRRWT